MLGPQISAGDLRHKIQLLIPQQATDNFGDIKPTWVNGPVVYARIRPLMGRTLWYAQQKRADATHEVMMRYRDDLTANHRFKYNGRTFEFGPPLTQDESTEVINMIAVEVLT